jgi:O-antigen/teichoic acid export membrane protein
MSWFETVPGARFARSVAVVSSGQLVALLLPFAAAPFLGRLYTPAEYGQFAAFLALSSFMGVLVTLQMQQAIIAEVSTVRAGQVLQLCHRIIAVMVIVSAAVVALLYAALHGRDDFIRLRGWLVLLPVSVLASGFIAAHATFANRREKYALLAGIQVAMTFAGLCVSLVTGIFGGDAAGLLAGYLSGQCLGLVAYALHDRQWLGVGAPINRRALFALLGEHRRFASYTTISEFLGTLSQQLPVLAFSGLGAIDLAGAFNRAQQLVAAPVAVISSSVGLVFRQRAALQYQTTGTCAPLYRRTLFLLTAASILPTLVLIWAAPAIFRVYLGPDWEAAGHIARLLAPMLFVRFVVSPLSTVFFFTEAQKSDSLIMLGGFALCVLLIALGARFDPSHKHIVTGYAAAYGVIYLVQLVGSYRLALGQRAAGAGG